MRQRIEDFKVEEIPTDLPAGDEYTIFWMEKFNWDTNRALHTLARKLRVSIKRLGIAGTKDKRAVTKQRVSAWRIPKEKIEIVNLKDIKLYDFSSSSERINLGMSGGNKFEITIRDVELEKDEIEKRLKYIFEELKKGIPNIFGPQRFGEVRPITQLVGKEMLKGNFEEAVKIYLTKVFDGEPDDAKTARSELLMGWGNKQAYLSALQIFPFRLRYERQMLDYLSKYPTDFAGAIRRLPKRLRKMFLNAVQAYAWNETMMKYFEENGQLDDDDLPLPGSDTSLDSRNPMQKIMIGTLNRQNVNLKEFEMQSMPEISTSGHNRHCLLRAKDVRIKEISNDDFNDGKKKVIISFSLPTGSYATVVTKEVMKND